MTIKEKIILLCQDESLQGEALVKALEIEVSKVLPFDHSAPTDLLACGLGDKPLRIHMEIPGGTASEIVEGFEKSMTKRQIALVLFNKFEETGEAVKIDSHKANSDLNSFGNFAKMLLSGEKEYEDGDEDTRDDFLKKLEELRDSLLKGLSMMNEGDSPESPDTCREENNSECWKCPHKKICTKFK